MLLLYFITLKLENIDFFFFKIRELKDFYHPQECLSQMERKGDSIHLLYFITLNLENIEFSFFKI